MNPFHSFVFNRVVLFGVVFFLFSSSVFFIPLSSFDHSICFRFISFRLTWKNKWKKQFQLIESNRKYDHGPNATENESNQPKRKTTQNLNGFHWSARSNMFRISFLSDFLCLTFKNKTEKMHPLLQTKRTNINVHNFFCRIFFLCIFLRFCKCFILCVSWSE